MPKPHLPAGLQRGLLNRPGPFCSCAIVREKPVILIKLEQETCTGLRGLIRIDCQPELGMYPSGAVIRLMFEFHDQPGNPLRMDTFLNVADPVHLRFLRMLVAQPVIAIQIFDETITDVTNKNIRYRETSRSELNMMIKRALQYNATLAGVNWPIAKADMMRDHKISLRRA